MRSVSLLAVGLMVVLGAMGAWAGEPAALPEGEPVAEAPAAPPLPLHSIEGFSGVFLTETAYFANLPEGDGWFGKPALAIHGTEINEKELVGATLTTNVFRRVEFGYSYQRLSLGDWDNDVEAATGLRIADSAVQLHTVGARLMVLREGEWDTTWCPALTLGARYKRNTDIDDINDDLAGVPESLGVDDDESVDFTVKASKTFQPLYSAPGLPLPGAKPWILSVGGRATEAIHSGFVGFSNDYDFVFEGSAIFFLTDRLVLAGEYRQMPHNLDRLGDLVKREDDWWSVALAYVCTNNLTATAGFANVGRVLDEDDNFAWLGQLKWEF